MGQVQFSVFTKPWQKKSLDELGAWVHGLGFHGIELPVRPGFQVVPEEVSQLPAAAKTLAQHNVKILSIAGPADEVTIAACAEAGVPTIRVMARIDAEENYVDAEVRLRREYDALIPLLDKYGVQLGVQNHCNRFVANAVGLRNIVGHYDRKHIAIVWDAAHEALEGSLPGYALDAAWSHLCMVNLKNGIRKRLDGTDEGYAKWQVHWTAGNAGFASWPDIVAELRRRHYSGVVCLTAEYSDHEALDDLIREDLRWAKALFAGEV